MSVTNSPNPSRIVWRDNPQITPAQIELAARRFTASLSPLEVRSFNGRIQRGMELARQSGAVCQRADPSHPRRYSVRSSDGFHAYLVDLEAGTCDCPDAQKGYPCKHRLAATFVEAALKAAAARRSTERILTELGF